MQKTSELFQIVIQIRTIEQWVKVNYMNLQYEDALQKVPNTITKIQIQKTEWNSTSGKIVDIHESQQSKHFVFLLISWALDSECFTWEILALHEKLNKKLTLISTIGAY